MTDMHAGHRERLRGRYEESGADAFADHELLELLLTYAIPRRDTNETAHLLLREFGSFSGIFQATKDELQRVNGIGPGAAQMLQLIGDIQMRSRLEKMERRSGKFLLNSPSRAAYYAASLFSGKRTESMFVLCLNAQRALIRKECVAIGAVSELQVYPQTVLRIAMAAGAQSVILAHNHPSGDPTPSGADKETTKRIVNALTPAGILFSDHIVVGDGYYYSFSADKMLHQIGDSFEVLTEEEYTLRQREITSSVAVVMEEYRME